MMESSSDPVDEETIEESHLSRYGPLQGDHLIDFSKLTAEGELPSDAASD